MSELTQKADCSRQDSAPTVAAYTEARLFAVHLDFGIDASEFGHQTQQKVAVDVALDVSALTELAAQAQQCRQKTQQRTPPSPIANMDVMTSQLQNSLNRAHPKIQVPNRECNSSNPTFDDPRNCARKNRTHRLRAVASKKWTETAVDEREHAKHPGACKASWSKHEDKMVTDYVEQFGPKKWTNIAALLPGRVGKQCRERFVQSSF